MNPEDEFFFGLTFFLRSGLFDVLRAVPQTPFEGPMERSPAFC